MLNYRYKEHHLRRSPVSHKVFFYILSVVILLFLVSLLSSGFKSFIPESFEGVFHRLTLENLLLYSLFTFLRLLIAYMLGLAAAFVALLVILSHEKLENFFVPIFDILQSVPVLAFFPLIIIAFAKLHMPELAAQIVLFVSMFWPIIFGALGGIHQIPEDILEASRIYGGRGFKQFSKVIFPAIFPNMVTGSILSWGSGWNVIIISEYINYGDFQVRLPGLGDLLSSSASSDAAIFMVSLITLILIITILDRLIWRKLIAYSEKFKFE